MTETSIHLPLRQLTRLRTEMMMASVPLFTSLFHVEPPFSSVVAAVARVSLPDWARDGPIARPDRPALGITVARIAASLGRDPESVRRRVKVLQGLGVFAATSQGVALAATKNNEAIVTRYYLQIHDLLLKLIEDMHATCDMDLIIGEAPVFVAEDIIARGFDMLLQQVERFRVPGPNHTLALVWGALAAAAVRSVTYDPVLSLRYANAIPPDKTRVGISLHRLSAAISLPYATTWRHTQTLYADGLVTRLDHHRWTVLKRNLLRDSISNISTPPSVFLLRMIRELAVGGLNPARAADYYAIGRPPLADLGPF